MGRPGLSLDRKFKRLARALDDVQAGFGEMLARGALELLWDSAYEACDDYLGDVDDVEAQAHWRGSRGTLLAGLVGAGGEGRCGFVEEGGSEWWPEGRPSTFRIHDLWDHAPEYAAKRAAREAEREEAGTTLSAIRSAAGKKGRRTQLEQKQANGGQVADQQRASGGQTDATCSGGAGKTRANGVPPSPTPSPTPSPSQTPSPPPADRLAGDDMRLFLLRSRLASELGFPKALGLGNDPDDAVRCFARWLDAAGEDATVAECLRLAREKGEEPRNLSWWVGWLDTVPDRRLKLVGGTP